jgi:hypothetical protein
MNKKEKLSEYDMERLKKNVEEVPPAVLLGHLEAMRILAVIAKDKGEERGVVAGQGWLLLWELDTGEPHPVAFIREGETLDDYLVNK